MSQIDISGYWLTRIIEENSSRLKNLPISIVHEQFSHVYNSSMTSIELQSGPPHGCDGEIVRLHVRKAEKPASDTDLL